MQSHQVNWVLQCAVCAVCYIVLQCAAVCCSVLQCAAVCCSVLQCVAVCYGVLQCVAVLYHHFMVYWVASWLLTFERFYQLWHAVGVSRQGNTRGTPGHHLRRCFVLVDVFWEFPALVCFCWDCVFGEMFLCFGRELQKFSTKSLAGLLGTSWKVDIPDQKQIQLTTIFTVSNN